MKTTTGKTITKGSGNVFADLGFSPAKSRNLRLRSQMMTALRKFIEKEGLTQADAAKAIESESTQDLRSDSRQNQPVFAGYAGKHAYRCRPGGRFPDQAAVAASCLARIIHIFRDKESLFMVQSRCDAGLRPKKRLSHERTYHDTVLFVARNF